MRASDMEVTYKPKDLMVKFEVLPLQPQPGDLTITTEGRLKPGLGYEDGRFFDTETGQYMSMSEAIERGLIVIDWESGMVINKYTNEVNSQGVFTQFYNSFYILHCFEYYNLSISYV